MSCRLIFGAAFCDTFRPSIHSTCVHLIHTCCRHVFMHIVFVFFIFILSTCNASNWEVSSIRLVCILLADEWSYTIAYMCGVYTAIIMLSHPDQHVFKITHHTACVCVCMRFSSSHSNVLLLLLFLFMLLISFLMRAAHQFLLRSLRFIEPSARAHV